MVALNIPAARSFYYSYPPYLTPASSLGSYNRITGSVALSTRPKIGGAVRIYNFFSARGRSQEFINQVIFANYGIQR
jgi:hypothetical protein